MEPSRPRVGLVLAGGAARGAYEAGVVLYLREGLPRETGVEARFDVLCGSSVGAINACLYAATAHRPAEQGALMAGQWSNLALDQVLQLRGMDVLRIARGLLGGSTRPTSALHESGFFNPVHVEQFVIDAVPWSMISKNLANGLFDSLSLSATHVRSGRTVVFVQRRGRELPSWGSDPFVTAVPVDVRPQHALASAAIPIVFPAVLVDGQFYCDGGLRQNTPLSPALRLGAERVLVISLRHVPTGADENPNPEDALPEGLPSPYFLAGKVINALWLDHVHYDLERMRRTNTILEAGTAAFGPDFGARLNASLVQNGAPPLRHIQEVRVAPSQDIGRLAAEYARTEVFARRSSGLTGRVLRRMAEASSPREADLLSYLLFDGAFCKTLVDMGYADAQARRDQLGALFSPA